MINRIKYVSFEQCIITHLLNAMLEHRHLTTRRVLITMEINNVAQTRNITTGILVLCVLQKLQLGSEFL